MSILNQKRALITGVASTRSIAWAIAETMHAQGAEIALSYQNERLKPRVEKCAAKVAAQAVIELDVSCDGSINNAMAELSTVWDGFDIIVHCIGFAPKEQLSGNFIDSIDREGFKIAHDISAYSLPALLKAARPQLRSGGAVTALTYLGAVRAVPNYNVMGLAKASLEAAIRYSAHALGGDNIRVNGISAGPIRTLAAAGIGNFKQVLQQVAAASAIPKNISAQQVANVASFLCSDMATGVTGEIIYVDNGYSKSGISI